MIDDQFTVKQSLAQVARARVATKIIACLSRNIATAGSPCEQKKSHLNASRWPLANQIDREPR
jgi:hypothetical protein